MKTKTWKIGEVCQGGIITVEIQGEKISVIGKEWDFSKGYRRSSDQSGAKEFTRRTFFSTDSRGGNQIEGFIAELSTFYWADQILGWIKSKITLNNLPMSTKAKFIKISEDELKFDYKEHKFILKEKKQGVFGIGRAVLLYELSGLTRTYIKTIGWTKTDNYGGPDKDVVIPGITTMTNCQSEALKYIDSLLS